MLAYALVDFVVEPIQHQFCEQQYHGGQLTVHTAWYPCPCSMALRCYAPLLPLIAAEFLGGIFLWQPDVGLDVLFGSSMVGGLVRLLDV